MRLYLIRHAIAEDRDAAAWPDDSLRPLTRRGVRRFRRAAAGLATLAPSVDVLLSSPLIRAWETAVILEKEAGWPSPIRCPELAADNPHGVQDIVKSYGEAESIALVGHEPYMSRLAAWLLSPGWGPWLQFRKGGAAMLETMADGEAPGYELIWHVTPRLLRALTRT
jgi:phosphohistidine phosphatase